MDKNPIQTIFLEHGEQFRNENNLSAVQLKSMKNVLLKMQVLTVTSAMIADILRWPTIRAATVIVHIASG
jgi:hypothetical protein